MTLQLMEGACTALQSYLEGAISSKLDELDAEYGDGITLDDIAKWYTGNIPTTIPAFPSVCVRGDGFVPTEMTDDKLFLNVFVEVVIFVGEQDDQVRFKKLSRYTRAVVELLPIGESEYGYIHWLEERIRITDTLNAPPWLQAVVIPIRLYTPSGESY